MTKEVPKFLHSERDGAKSFTLCKYKDGRLEVHVFMLSLIFQLPADMYKHKRKSFIIQEIKESLGRIDFSTLGEK